MVIPDNKRQKLDDKGKKLIFIGYAEGTKGYRLLDPTTDKIYISKDVKFLEGNPHENKEPKVEIKQEEEKANETECEIQVILENTTSKKSLKDNREIKDVPGEHEICKTRISHRYNKGKANHLKDWSKQ